MTVLPRHNVAKNQHSKTFIFTGFNQVTKQIEEKLQSSSQYLTIPHIEIKQVKSNLLNY